MGKKREMKIEELEVLPLRVPNEERLRTHFHHFGMTEEVTVYRLLTDTGLIGLAENVGPPSGEEILGTYLGTDPFDHLMGWGPFIWTWAAMI